MSRRRHLLPQFRSPEGWRVVVKLKSGGPAMTVEWVKEGSAKCTWFEGSKVEAHIFPAAALVAYDELMRREPGAVGGGFT